MNSGNTIQLSSLNGIKKVYFIGIGGIGMSAIARYFLSKGISVSGYDKTSTELTKELEAEGMSIHYTEELDAIPKEVDLVVYTPAVPKDHEELVYYQQKGYKVVKRSDVLQAISADSFNICVAGTHGKTTVTTMVSHILRHTGYGCNAFLGGISVNYGTNFWSSDNNVCVIEADEYDRSFLKLSPDIAVITSMDADHLDIYGDEKSVQDAFVAFGNKVREGGMLLSKFGLGRVKEITSPGKKLTYSLQNDVADVYAMNLRINEGGYLFDVHLNDKVLSNVELKIGGMHNVENVLVAIAVAHSLEIGDGKIKAAVADFKGVRRRFEYVIPPKKQVEGGYIQTVLIDDYAHHPEELKTLLKSVRSLFPQRHITVVFQPHLFSRTKDFAEGFADALSLADRVFLLPIYPARELPIEGVTSQMIANKIEMAKATVMTRDELLELIDDMALDEGELEVLVMAGAGDIDALVSPVKKIIERK
jgi:UDP-N-acetylmuramate--alanine ligase